MSRFAIMRQQLATIETIDIKAVPYNDPLHHKVALVAGAVIPIAKTFYDGVKISYKYHEAIRKGELVA